MKNQETWAYRDSTPPQRDGSQGGKLKSWAKRGGQGHTVPPPLHTRCRLPLRQLQIRRQFCWPWLQRELSSYKGRCMFRQRLKVSRVCWLLLPNSRGR
ncbi:hypothetical protein DPEC_G00018840 [Dallia pectoralis]|uniref:Uncharacterized protein n=1 Tax=Dallia pectoralis TaxID=75939 RepID=A0ACC2HGW9_DALPE|nr:hypothetical protein DPEC_G00018840 [Dallia pectoralis]